MSTSRVEAFSDGVFAVAITLLVFNLQVPRVDEVMLGTALLQMWPAYASYIVSFVTIGIIWVNHHQIFALVQRVDRRLIFLNLILLMVAAFLPFPTALLGGYISTGDGSHVAAVIYGGTMTALAVSFSLMWTYIVRHEELLRAHVDPTLARQSVPRFAAGMVVYLLATVIGLLSAVLTLALYALVAVYYIFNQLPLGDHHPDAVPVITPRSEHQPGSLSDASQVDPLGGHQPRPSAPNQAPPPGVASEYGGAERFNQG